MKKIDKKKMIKKKDILFLGFSNIQSHVESTNDEDSDEEIQGANVEGDEQDEGIQMKRSKQMNYIGT
ncbi:hypothetical protein Tco_0028392 [Tanacetum coccineum]